MKNSIDPFQQRVIENELLVTLSRNDNKYALDLLHNGIIQPSDKFSPNSVAPGTSILNYCIFCDNTEMVKHLTDMGANITEWENEPSMNLIPGLPKLKTRFSVMELLPRLFDSGTALQYTPLFMSVEKNNTEIIDYLHEKGANLEDGFYFHKIQGNQIQKFHLTPLILSILKKNEATAISLLNKGASPFNGMTSSRIEGDTLIYKNELSPLVAAAQFGMDKVVSYVLNKGVHPHDGGPLMQEEKIHPLLQFHYVPFNGVQKAVFDNSEALDAIQQAIRGRGTIKTLGLWSQYYTMKDLSTLYFTEAMQSQKSEILDAFLKHEMSNELQKTRESAKTSFSRITKKFIGKPFDPETDLNNFFRTNLKSIRGIVPHHKAPSNQAAKNNRNLSIDTRSKPISKGTINAKGKDKI